MKKILPQATTARSIIPEFCRLPALLVVGYVMLLVAVLLTLASGGQSQRGFALLAIYLLWIGFSGAAALCLTRRWLLKVRTGVMFFACWALLVLVTGGVAYVAWQTEGWLRLGLALGPSLWEFVLRNVCIGGIVSLLLLRYFWERHQWQEEARAEADARYLALQARIRPHFLFNSLNSLAELIATRPQQAEDMVVDLADLFRVSLDSRQKLVTLREEIDIVKGYLRIEEIRLGDKLSVNWDVGEATLAATLPRLILQPLVENAVLHGVSRLRARGMLTVNARREGEMLVIDVENPLPPEDASPREGGTGTAVNNIAQRIKLIYGERARLSLGREESELGAFFRANLRLPFATGEQAVTVAKR